MKALTWPNAAKIALVFALGLNFFAVYHSFQTNEAFHPLVNEVPQIVAPLSMSVNGTVNVTAVKCNNSSTPVVAIGTSSFQAVEHPEVIFPRSAGSVSVKLPGCKTTRFQNPILDNVKSYVAAQGHAVAFKIVGTEIPMKTTCVGVTPTDTASTLLTKCHGEKEGTPATWFTDEFNITP